MVFAISRWLKKWWRWIVRVVGLVLLGWLLLRIDISGSIETLGSVHLGVSALAAVLLIPLISIKAFRWLLLMGSPIQGQLYYEACLSYFSGLFLGFLTPGRLGEFVRIFYARRRLGGDTAVATISVLVDRLLDLTALLILGGVALLSLPVDLGLQDAFGWLFIFAGCSLPILLLLGSNFPKLSRWLSTTKLSIGQVNLGGLLGALLSIRQSAILIGTALTGFAYLLFFGQGALLAKALDLPLNYLQVAFTLSLASLVALLPISISGLGTREWVITLYLGSRGIEAETALAYSALIFITFNLWGSLLGALSWFVYPEGLKIGADSPALDSMGDGSILSSSLPPRDKLD